MNVVCLFGRLGLFIPINIRGMTHLNSVATQYDWVAMSCSGRKSKSIAPFLMFRMKTPSHQRATSGDFYLGDGLMKKNFSIIVILLSLCGCSTIVSGTQQSVFIETPHANGAECKLTDSKSGSWYLNDTPASITVAKGNGPMNVTCNKKGYKTTTISVDEEVAGATFGNIILGGGIGILVDAASGAAQKYPDKIVVWIKPQQFDSSSTQKAWENEKAAYEQEQKKKAEEPKQQTSQNNQ